jgi:hypothetical protein
MAMTPGAAPSRIFYGCDLIGGYGAVVAVVATLLRLAAGLSIAINETVRPGRCVVSLPGRPHPVAGGR